MNTEIITEIIARSVDANPADIDKSMTMDQLKIDTLGMVDIIMDIEDAFNTTIDDPQPCTTVGELIEYLESAVAI